MASNNRHSRTGAVIVCLLLLLGFGTWLAHSIMPPGVDGDANVPSARRVVATGVAHPDVRQRSQLPPNRPPADALPPDARPLPEAATAQSLARTTADDYRARARYPRWSQPLPEGDDPLLRDRQVSPVTSAGPNGDDPTLTVFPDQVSFEAPDSVLLYAFLSAGGQRIAADSIRATVESAEGQQIGEVVYKDDGSDGDLMAGDGIYTARLTLESGLPERTASYLVKVRAVTLEQQERLAAGGFLYSHPDAQLTGTYRDAHDGGDLAIDAELDVNDTGRFHLEATLYSQDGQVPIAWAQQAAELSSGRQWLQLRFHGLVMNERQIDGPYLLRFVALSTTTQMPNAKNRLVENAYVTGRYRAADFSDQPFNDPDLIDAADRIEGSMTGPDLDAGG
jgi:hypothetical protein